MTVVTGWQCDRSDSNDDPAGWQDDRGDRVAVLSVIRCLSKTREVAGKILQQLMSIYKTL